MDIDLGLNEWLFVLVAVICNIIAYRLREDYFSAISLGALLSALLNAFMVIVVAFWKGNGDSSFFILSIIVFFLMYGITFVGSLILYFVWYMIASVWDIIGAIRERNNNDHE